MERKRDSYPPYKKDYSQEKRFEERPKRPFKCNPTCRHGHFVCIQNHLGRRFQNKKGWWVYECKYVEGGLCEGSRCKFSDCKVRKMKTDGTCGFTLVQKPKDEDWDKDDEDIEEEHDLKKLQKSKGLNIPDKAFKKLKKFQNF